MALLNHGSPPTTSAANPQHRVTGQYLARAHLDRQQRAKLAAALANGTTTVFPLTATQSAAMARVSVADVTKVRRNGNGSKPRRSRESLAEHIARSSLAERLEAARIIGLDVIWDTMIAPVVSEERAAETNVTV
jgi:hypothetical protein